MMLVLCSHQINNNLKQTYHLIICYKDFITYSGTSLYYRSSRLIRSTCYYGSYFVLAKHPYIFLKENPVYSTIAREANGRTQKFLPV